MNKTNTPSLSLDRQVWRKFCDNRHFPQLRIMIANNFKITEEDVDYLLNALNLDKNNYRQSHFSELLWDISEIINKMDIDFESNFGPDYWTHTFKEEGATKIKKMLELQLKSKEYQFLGVLEKIDFLNEYHENMQAIDKYINQTDFYNEHKRMTEIETEQIIKVIEAQSALDEKNKISDNLPSNQTSKKLKQAKPKV